MSQTNFTPSPQKIQPQFEREIYNSWLISGLGNDEQRARYRAALAWFDDLAQPSLQLDLYESELARQATEQQPFEQLSSVSFVPRLEEQAEPPQPAPVAWPEWSVTYPNIGLAAINHNHGRAWVVWALVKALDNPGNGWVSCDRLRSFLAVLGVGERQQRRWISVAKRLGLILPGGSIGGEIVYYAINPVRAAIILGCKDIWKPAKMRISDLVHGGWHRYIWAAFLSTLGGKPMSQVKKYELTGVEPRVQRLYQAPDESGETLSYPTFNYSTSNIDLDHLSAMREVTGWNYILSGNEVRQRLPDGRVVSPRVVMAAPIGERTRKVRRSFSDALLLTTDRGNAADHQGNDDEGTFRLFHVDTKRADHYLKRLTNVSRDLLPWDVFARQRQRERVTTWEAVNV